MNMNTLIIELGGSHIECIYTFVHALKMKNSKVHLCCNLNLLPLFPEKNKVDGILEMPEKFSLATQITCFLSIRNYIKKHEITHVVINTCELKIIRNLFYFLPAKLNYTGQVHNSKKLEKSVTFTKILSKKMKKYFVLGDHLLKALKPDPIFLIQSIYPIYYPAFQANTIQKKQGEKWIVIPGGVAMERRDYLPLIDAIKDGVWPEEIKFVFLGKYYLNNHVNEDWKQTSWWKKHIIHFEQGVPYDVFHNYIFLADLILPLIKLEGDTMYGDGRISGSFNLALGYQKPMLLPESYNRNTDLSDFSLYYQNIDELCKMVIEIAKDDKELKVLTDNYKRSKYNNWNEMSDNIVSFIAS